MVQSLLNNKKDSHCLGVQIIFFQTLHNAYLPTCGEKQMTTQ